MIVSGSPCHIKDAWGLRACRAAGATLALAALGAVSPVAAQQPDAPFITGADTHFAQGAGDPATNLAVAAQAGIHSIRDEIYWWRIEQQPGQLAMPADWDRYVDEALRLHIEPLIVLDYGNAAYDGGNKPRSDAAIAAFTRYAEFVARHFQGKVRRFEVWNEWDNAGGSTTPGSPQEYAALLRSVYPALKAVDPAIEVLADASITLSPRDADGKKADQPGVPRFADAVAFHPYFYNRGPKKTPEAWADWMQQTEASLRRDNDGATVPLYVTEIGWPTFSGRDGISLGRSAAYAARLLLLARTLPFLKGVWWYDLRNDGKNAGGPGHNFGLLWPDSTPKPAYYAIADVDAALADATLVERKPTGDDDDWLLRFRRANGEELWALWTAKDNALARFRLATLSTAPRALKAQEAGHRAVERAWAPAPHGHGTSLIDITVGETPVLLNGGLADVTVAGVEHQEFPDDLR